MPNMFDRDHPDNQDGEGTSPYGNQKFGGQTHGGYKTEGKKYGGQKFGASADREELHTPDEEAPPPREAVDTRSWGERHSMGAKPGGNTFGGNTYGGNTFGGNRFGASAGPGETGGEPLVEGPSRIHGPTFPGPSPNLDARHPAFPTQEQLRGGSNAGTERSTDTDIHPPQQPDTPAGNNAGTERSTDEDIHPPQQPETKKMPPVTVTGSRPGGGGKGGGGRRKPLGDQTREEAYDPTLDKADPRNVAIVDEQGRVNPKLYEDSQKGALDPTKPGVKTGEQAAKYTNNYTASLAGATKYMTDTFHQKPGDPLQAEGYTALTHGGVGKPDPKVVDGVFNVIDPNNELQPKEKMELATRAMHDWYVAKGDPKSADKVAGEMLQHGSAQAKIFGNTALQALKAGDKETAAKAIQGAYAWLPDGYHADISNDGKLVLHDGKGNVDKTIPLDDKQLANLGTGLATGTLYWDLVQHRAGVEQPFGPPKPPPTQAIATAPPGGAPGATPPSPVAAPTAAPTPGAPPVQPPGPPGPPPAAPAPPGVTPPGTPVPPPPQPPVPSRPAAPAPAAPGPAPTQQAAPAPPTPPPPPPPPQGSGGPPGSPAGPGGTQTAANVPAPAPAIETKPPEKMVTFAPTGPGPAKPAETKPAETKPADTTVTTENAPPDTKVETGKPPPVAKPDEKKAEDTRGKLVYNKTDPDTVPTLNGKEYTYRKNSTDITPEVRQALKDREDLNKWYIEKKKWIFEEEGKSKAKQSKQFTANIAALRQGVDAQYNGLKKEIEGKISSFNQERRENDKDEKAALKPKYPSESDLVRQEERVNTQLKGMIDNKDPLIATNVLRNVKSDGATGDVATDKTLSQMRDTIIEIHAHNQDVPLNKVVQAVVAASSHLEVGPKSKQQTANDGSGPTASRFRVLGRDLSGHPVIQVGVGNSTVKLHMPDNILGDIKRFKSDSYQDKKSTLEKGTKSWERGQRLKGMAPDTESGAFKRNVGRAVDFVYGKDKPPELP